MGCWNGTCMISNLPIMAGDKVKLVFLHAPYGGAGSVLNQSAYCYPTGILSPAFLAITGEYDDYGTIENIVKDWNYNLIEKILKDKLGNILKVDGEKNISDWTLEEIIRGIERGGLEYFNVIKDETKDMMKQVLKRQFERTVSDRTESLSEVLKSFGIDDSEEEPEANWHKADLSFVMIRQDIWDFAVSQMSREMVHDRESEQGTYKEIEYSKHLRKEFENSIRKSESTYISLYGSVFTSSSESRGNLIGKSVYAQYVSEAPKEELEDIFKQWSEYVYVGSFLNRIRKGWMIQEGAGSQDASWEHYIALSKKVIDICDAQLKKWDE